VYLERAVEHLRAQGEAINDTLLGSLSPLGWDHINLTGDYVWPQGPGAKPNKFRSLRTGRKA